jgi:glycogen synthase
VTSFIKSSDGGLRLVFMAGPGDATSVLRAIAEGRTYDGIAHVAYSRQVFETCERLGVPVLSICTNPKIDDFSHGLCRSINIGDPLANRRRLRYHLTHISYVRMIAKLARDFGAQVIITATEPYLFLFEHLAWRGIHVIPAFNALLQPAFGRPSLANRAVTRLSRHFLSKSCSAILSHPGPGVRQSFDLTGGKPRPILEFLPLYERDMYASVRPPEVDADEFRVLTVGRCEDFKGAFDFVEIAKQCRALGQARITFDWCGTGASLEEAQRRVRAEGLEASVRFHGWTSMEELTDLWSRSHVCIVPTTSRFVEGFNQVVVEAAIAGRPIITSAVCPALEFVRECSIEVPVDDVGAYVKALLSLADDRARYAALQSRCARAVEPFFDESRSFGAAIRHIVQQIRTNGTVEQRHTDPRSRPG